MQFLILFHVPFPKAGKARDSSATEGSQLWGLGAMTQKQVRVFLTEMLSVQGLSTYKYKDMVLLSMVIFKPIVLHTT